ncbi:LysM peptidoglycan-binding domain-containing protein [Domibacillus sp. A3M-37]|uniref:M14 family metallopeptidase n=1 Tax=Domibacillus sp. A3M-37 TaxID=2962037 RepID=UPI0020B806AD|nr:M14 family metallopeptidase [Domibacillus sp. A3M-37]MCP3763892.1 LysM peptidoglycan-binding domain-containing protein [Domibacillus sp. A3M-37]
MDIFVRPGDSLWYYSQLFTIHLQLIRDSNRELQSDRLTVGQRVRIPGFVTRNYRIKGGDSLWSLSQNYMIPIDTIVLANPGLVPDQLQVGQTISVPSRVTWRIVQGKRPYDYGQMMTDIRQLRTVYPFLRVPSIGRSVLDKEIPEVTIGNGMKRVHSNGSFHANEWITTPVIMTFLNDYVLSLTNQNPIRGLSTYRLYQESFLSIVPMVNPDGVNLVVNGPPASEPWRSRVVELNNGNEDFSGWKANIQGVDLNDQFPAKWEEERENNPKEPGPRDYGGERPLTEPEAIAMAELTRRRDFSRVLAFHTQGKEIYWGFANSEPLESETLVREFGRVSGYEPVHTIESYAGYKDWFIQEWRRPGFTIELGQGTNPLPITQFDEIYQEALSIFLAGLYM